jgi:hypothetical protein
VDIDPMLLNGVTDALLTGDPTPADRALLAEIIHVVNAGFAKVRERYAQWRLDKGSASPSLPQSLSIVSHYRSFDRQARIVRDQLDPNLRSASTDQEIEAALRRILTTRSMPGFSRHHWGTDIDIVSVKRSDWQPNRRLAPLIPFIRAVATEHGFFTPYSAGTGSPRFEGFPRPSQPHHDEEPWHLSYWPIANHIQQEWTERFQGPALVDLLARVAPQIRGPVSQETMERVLEKLDLLSYQTNIAAPPPRAEHGP